MHSSDSVYNLPPFPAHPSIDRFVGLGSVQDAVDRIERSIQARDAISVVIGPPGTGKTLISELLASRHHNSHRVITLGETPLPDSDSFLRRVLHQAGADLNTIPGGDLQLALFDHICLGDHSAPRILLLIDEAQSLSPELLETIRTLTNLTRDGEPRVSVVMFGGNHLDELLIAPAMDGFRQRISTRCYLHPLNNEETGWYINQTIRNCGCDPDATITADAISAVHHACSGVPRLINQLLSHAIEFAADKDEYLITDRIIDQSWAEVQQLPSPMVDEPEIAVSGSTVEFGELDSFDAPSVNGETTEYDFDQDFANTDTDTSVTTAEPDADAYDAYDFENDGHPETSTSYAESTEFQSDSEIKTDAMHNLPTEVWGDGDEINLHDRSEESSLEENSLERNREFHVANTSNTASPDDQLDIDELISPALQYPQLASPALDPNEDLLSENLTNELSEDFIPTQSNDDLFGSFADEEQIDLRTVPSRSEMTDEGPAETLENATPQEMSIHQEIVGISDLLNTTESEKFQYCDDAHQLPNKMHHDAGGMSPDVISFEDEHEHLDKSAYDSATLDVVSAQHVSPIQFQASEEQASEDQADLDEPKKNTLHQDEIASQPQHDSIRLRHDDSDMLIIEDEVDIHRIDKRETTMESGRQSIDYQNMLKRMRSKKRES